LKLHGQETTSTDQPGSGLPKYFDYLSLVFQIIMTMMILPMAGWVFVTIKTIQEVYIGPITSLWPT